MHGELLEGGRRLPRQHRDRHRPARPALRPHHPRRRRAQGRFIRERLAREGVDTAGVHTDPQRLTSLVLLGIRDEKRFPLIFYRDDRADAALDVSDIDEALIASAIVVTGTRTSVDGSRVQADPPETRVASSSAVSPEGDPRPTAASRHGVSVSPRPSLTGHSTCSAVPASIVSRIMAPSLAP